MLKKFAAVLLATSMIAGAAFAAETTTNAGSPPATVAADSAGKIATAKPAKLAKHVKHASKHGRKHVAHAKRGTKLTHHGKTSKTHKAHVVRHKSAKAAVQGNVKTAKLPANRGSAN